MKTAAIVMIVLVLAVGGALGWALFNTNLRVIAKGMQVYPAQERIGEFEQVKLAANQRSLLGTLLKTGGLGEAKDYSFYVYSLRLKNNGLVPAEMVEMQISPIAQDVLFYGAEEEIIIMPGESRDVWCVLLTEGAPTAVREIYITYYLWGHAQEVKFTYDDAR